MSNRLANESSPYLLQHAHNPVDWFPWGTEAFDKARVENKPVLVSIGYSTCHWCHVMERECFENPAIAAVMNEHVVSIKVDREERPDVDRFFMAALQALTGQGGWPLNMFTTPEGKPFIGGTYFPPQTRHGHRGWPDVVASIGQAWRDPVTREKLMGQSQGLTEAARTYLVPDSITPMPRAAAIEHCRMSLEKAYDGDSGGFSTAPKFPMPVNMMFLFRYAAAKGGAPGEKARDMALTTLRAMARGGIYDQVGGGFHRYSTDDRWFLPHFEKTLYDNAQLATVLVDAFQLSADPFFSTVAAETLDYLCRELGRPDGGFCSAEDADSAETEGSIEKTEGARYVWAWDELSRLLGADAELFARRYGANRLGNVEMDPHGDFSGKNVLHGACSLEEAAAEFHLPLEEACRRLGAAREKVMSARQGRPRPSLDDKIVTGWNGLALSALARGGSVLQQPRWIEAARRTASFLQRQVWDGERLWRVWRGGRRYVEGFADDHAFLAQGLTDLFGADFSLDRLLWAERLMDIVRERFQEGGADVLLSSSVQDRFLPFRAQEEADNVEPSAASVAALTMARLGRLLGREDFLGAAERMIDAHVSLGGRWGFPALQAAGLLIDSPPQELVIAGDPSDTGTKELLNVARKKFIPFLSVILVDADRTRWEARRPALKGMVPIQGRSAAYVCDQYSCRPAVTTPEDLAQILET